MKIMNNRGYVSLVANIWSDGDDVTTRGASTRSLFGSSYYVTSPIITVRHTSWKTALSEMEWFMSGSEQCPSGTLKDIWWRGQLSQELVGHDIDGNECLVVHPGNLHDGYPTQLRGFVYYNSEVSRESGVYEDGFDVFDQVEWLKSELKNHPQSRRLIMTTWNPGEMAKITKTNNNPMVPACCHMNYMQFQVRNGILHMNTVFRSTDTVLGLPHNLVQHRALHLYFAHHAEVPAADYYKLFLNDAHVYSDHCDFAEWCVNNRNGISMIADPHGDFFDLRYNPTSDQFIASDFSLTNSLPQPMYTDKIIRTL